MSKDSLSPRETEVLALAWQCMDSEPKIDFDKLARLAGYGSRGSASVTFGNIKRKLKSCTDKDKSTPKSTPKKSAPIKTPMTPKSGGKRGATTLLAANESPSKKKKSTKQTTMGYEDEEDYQDFKIKEEDPSELLSGVNQYYGSTRDYDDQFGGFGSYDNYDGQGNAF